MLIAFIYSDKSSVLYSDEHEHLVFYLDLMYFVSINLLSTVCYKQFYIIWQFSLLKYAPYVRQYIYEFTAVFTEHSNLEGIIKPFSTSTAWEISNIFSFPLMVFVNSLKQKHSSRMRHKMNKQWLKTYQDNNAKHNLLMPSFWKAYLNG